MNDFSKYYKELSFEDISKKWDKVDKPISVYIHSPFCKSLCKFCFYTGTLYNSKQYEKYYDEYLPTVINLYKNILSKKEIQSWFFGGGTPSLLDEKRMKKLFESLPKFKDQGEKTIEIHPAFWTIEQLDLLKEYNFDNVIIGVQTFDVETLKNQNRIPANFEEIKKLTNELKKRNIRISYDIIGFLNDKIEDRNILRNDLELAYELDPDEITVQTSYELKKKYDKVLMDEILSSSLYLTKKYLLPQEALKLREQNKSKIVDINALLSELSKLKTLRFFKKEIVYDYLDRSLFSFVDNMDEVLYADNFLPILANEIQPVIGIGSLRNAKKNTFSNIDANQHYIEINEESYPRFYMVLEHDFHNELDKMVATIKKAGIPPRGIKFEFENQIIIRDRNTILQRPVGLKYNIYYDYAYYSDEHKEKVKNYIRNLGQILEDEIDKK